MKKTKQNQIDRLSDPYCLSMIEGQENRFEFLNRDYQPIWYEMAFSIDPKSFTDIFTNVASDKMWLYDDGEESRINYHVRLNSLLALASKTTN